MKYHKIFLPAFLSFLFLYQTYPHVQSTVNFRVTNRRFISHILLETRYNQPHITLITSHPVPWNFYAGSHPLHYKCRTNCLEEIEKLHSFLETGYNIGLRLNGSEILEIIYYDP